jgi:beta-glucosidase
MSDWGGLKETSKALNAELDYCEGNDLYIEELLAAIKSGLFDASFVERAIRSVLRTKVISGMIDGVPLIPGAVIDSKEHRELIRFNI